MTVEIKVPFLGESVFFGEVTYLSKKKGDYIRSGEILANLLLETGKSQINFEMKVDTSGLITELFTCEGDDVKEGDAIGLIDETAKNPK